MQKTHHPDVDNLLEDLLSQIQQVLPEKLVGLYLYGSLTTGDFDHAISDIDLLAATSSDVTEKEVDLLREMHSDFAHTDDAWADRIDISYLSLSALKTFRDQRSPMAGITPGEPFTVKEVGKGWTVNWYLVSETGLTLFGPPPQVIIDPISQGEFVQATQDHAALWGKAIKVGHSLKEQAYAIFVMCRALYVRHYGQQTSKEQAALWAQQQMPDWSNLIHNALIWRRELQEHQANPDVTYTETVKFVDSMRNKVVE